MPYVGVALVGLALLMLVEAIRVIFGPQFPPGRSGLKEAFPVTG